ncbi:MAG: nuclear transport factor 2 family protein [Betaproteobacteria bacterium]|nr:nuclear transport factor 2 family protein [Pseudomonadota bacterium]NBP34920.1 nuclear transport factor 2 family protein [Betaproteobacteria bacterium]NDG81483.1 nuclear transport factor 2 family protein [Betaproteobacteria bacterium]
MRQTHSCTDSASISAKLNQIKAFYETLSPSSLDQISELYGPEARFKDPFQSVQGLPAIRAVFEHMFAIQPHSRFVVDGITQTAHPLTVPAQSCLRWTYWLVLRGKTVSIQGCTWLCLDQQGYIVDHRDYWDAAEELYEKLPVLSWLMRWLRRKIAPG